MNCTVKFLEIIKDRLKKKTGESEYQIAKNRFGRVQSSYQQLEKNKLLPLKDFPAIRKMAIDAGYTDEELNDLIEADGKKLKK